MGYGEGNSGLLPHQVVSILEGRIKPGENVMMFFFCIVVYYGWA